MHNYLKRARPTAVFLIIWLTLVSCNQSPAAPTAATAQPTTQPTAVVTPTRPSYPTNPDEIDFVTVAIDAPNRDPNFATIDEFGRIVGFEADLLANLSAQAGFDYEFVVTPYDGLLESVVSGEFDTAVSALIIPDSPPEGIAFTDPYLEVGQVLVVRANERNITRFDDLPPTANIGVQANSSGAQTALDTLALPPERLLQYDTVPATLQALIDLDVDGVIIDSDDAEQYTANYYQQLRQVGEGEGAWLTKKQYGIAVAADNTAVLTALNNAIAQAHEEATTNRLIRAWLIPQEKIIAGESLIGTLDNEFIVGMVANEINMDPAAAPDPVSWEMKTNVMSGLMRHTVDNELIPALASDFPVVSPSGLEYTFTLRPGLTFSNGAELTAEDVRWSLQRAAGFGNFLINAFLKDSNQDGFADEDAVQVIDAQTVKIVLDEPTPYFLTLLATPPYFVISDSCYTPTEDPNNICGGIGPYTITDWDPGTQVRLKVNPQWPATPATFENVAVRFYNDGPQMQRSLEIGAIDVAWVGLGFDELNALASNTAVYTVWRAPATFKSYLVFEQQTPPWNLPQVRQAASLALDRQALADLSQFQDTRLPLLSPVPDDVPGHLSALPERNLEEAQTLLGFVGYTPSTPLPITISYVNDGRYSPFEAEYAQLIKAQLEETDIFQVTLEGAPYDSFRQQSATCNTPAFILGWPPSGQPPNYIDPAYWMNYFIFNTDTLCSNYSSPQMTALVTQLTAVAPDDQAARNDIYAAMQTLWAEEYPTLDLTQETRLAVSLNKVTQVKMDALGLLHYGELDKGVSAEP
jgi:peptide/nickel transport system substrate-binding protein